MSMDFLRDLLLYFEWQKNCEQNSIPSRIVCKVNKSILKRWLARRVRDNNILITKTMPYNLFLITKLEIHIIKYKHKIKYIQRKK